MTREQITDCLDFASSSSLPLFPDRFYLSCMGYPACKTAVWFPDFVLDVARDESICAVCKPHPVHR